MTEAPPLNTQAFKRGALIYPQPVAAACGRILRVSNPQERIDACIKAAEVLCRYLSALALSSLRGRQTKTFPSNLPPLKGDLSFGHYLSLIQAAAKASRHPLETYLAPFRPRRRGKDSGPGKADEPLVELLELRNALGHDLAVTEKARAIALLNRYRPQERLAQALRALDGVLSLPLFVLHELGFQDMQMVGQRLLLMGESPDPVPDEILLLKPLQQQMPYIALGEQALRLPPIMLFALIEEQQAFRLAFLDAVHGNTLRFKTLQSSVLEHNARNHEELMAVFDGDRLPPEELALPDGATMAQEWANLRKMREADLRRTEGTPPWGEYDPHSLAWYAERLPNARGKSDAQKIVTHLLDGRTTGLTEDELRQLLLLFDKELAVRAALGREMHDFRSMSKPGPRWDKRTTGSGNILATLKAAIDFFAAHVGLDASESADLTRTHGSADYIAMREALVNQFIHQDYSDSSAAAQIELTPRRAMFFNAGHSLVTEDHLADGGKSQARNPLIARALRLIGYAELAGSGIRALQHEWRRARRRPPVIESDRTGNTFALTLDWREVPNAYDKTWREKLGVQLTTEQASVLNLATDTTGITEHQAAAGAGLELAEAREALSYLSRQVLVEKQDDRYHLKAHLREALK